MGLSEIIFHDSAKFMLYFYVLFLCFIFGFSFADRNLGKMGKIIIEIISQSCFLSLS